MKKIKTRLSKRKVKGVPHIGIYLHVERRYTLAQFTLAWFKDLQTQLKDSVRLSIWISGEPDPDLDQILIDGTHEEAAVFRVSVTKGLSRGRQLNEGLEQLKGNELDAVIPVAPGDLLTEKLLLAYRDHLRDGGLFCGLLDQYIYDPTSLRCMHWSRAEFYEGSKRACELGMMIAKPMLKALKWQLWPSTSDRGLDALHGGVMERMSEAFKMAPPKTCLLQSMAAYEAPVVALKSELGRVLFDEGNWQKFPGLSFADFELVFEDHLGEAWIQRVEDLDERINLDILVEPPPPGASYEALWRELYDYLPFKFDPYARVNLHVICDPDQADEIKTWGNEWSPLPVTAQGDTARWNEAINALAQGSGDAILLGGRGSIVDLKTIEHYLIYLFKNGAKLLSASNFFLALSDERQGYFWPGIPGISFKDIFGFGTCIHRSYLTHLGPSPLSESGGLSEAASQALNELCAIPNTQEERVMFQCVAHKLGLIAFDIEGAVGFSPTIRLADLKSIKISRHMPGPALIPSQQALLTSWEDGQELSQHTNTTRPTFTTSDHAAQGEPSMTAEPNESTMSPLERARALLKRGQAGDQAQAEPVSTRPSTPEQTAAPSGDSSENLSPLERAKALLASSAEKRQATAAPTAQPATETESPQAQSPLERAKALLQQSTSSTAAPVSQAEPATAQQESSSALSPLERAKALLKQSTSPAQPESSQEPSAPQKMLSPLEKAKALLKKSETTSSESTSNPQDADVAAVPQKITQVVIDSALEGAEALVQHLQTQLNLAQQQVAEAESHQEDSSVSGPSTLMCEQGEAAYESGDESKATTFFESALMIDPSNVRALNNLGVMALSGEEPWRALSYFLMGLIQAPSDEDLLLNLHGLFDLNPEMQTVRSVIFDG